MQGSDHTLGTSTDITMEELQLAARNHSMPLEALRYDVTPLGLHYLLTHFDIPEVDPASWRLDIGGAVRKPVALALDDLKAMPKVTAQVILECAGNGRAHNSPRPISQPWLYEAVGNAEWTGTPLRPLLEAAGPLASAVEVVFTGLDRGVQGGIEQLYERSLSVGDTRTGEAFVAYEMNGQPLSPQHGYPLRLVIPGWYGMAQVKWLRSITLVDQPFRGYQQEASYHIAGSDEDPGVPVTRMVPRSLMIPPGIPDFMSRSRFVSPGSCVIEGRAWSGHGPIKRVQVSTDAGSSWAEATVKAAVSEFAWQAWRYAWNAEPGEHELCCRAEDSAGNVQPLKATWNTGGYCNNEVQRIKVVVGSGVVPVQAPAPSALPNP
ncbi:MAG TPA: sulfite oxidase [Candidatus Dormibacteraeota bacterium]|nr:sulfite oxidase [Candidatus Dormibacteraeota bacterium]